ncbi:hypothetical protein PR048_023194 [Dryococelus australis]|uniref:Uncharacterized protein n=1 Tax=Dryococelus australis TaxID=614101 RepID=A0ABQ9GTE2_9NEOP|nr:hypothetical protein PR048_023194 [Dryococelus australis]
MRHPTVPKSHHWYNYVFNTFFSCLDSEGIHTFLPGGKIRRLHWHQTWEIFKPLVDLAESGRGGHESLWATGAVDFAHARPGVVPSRHLAIYLFPLFPFQIAPFPSKTLNIAIISLKISLFPSHFPLKYDISAPSRRPQRLAAGEWGHSGVLRSSSHEPRYSSEGSKMAGWADDCCTIAATNGSAYSSEGSKMVGWADDCCTVAATNGSAYSSEGSKMTTAALLRPRMVVPIAASGPRWQDGQTTAALLRPRMAVPIAAGNPIWRVGSNMAGGMTQHEVTPETLSNMAAVALWNQCRTPGAAEPTFCNSSSRNRLQTAVSTVEMASFGSPNDFQMNMELDDSVETPAVAGTLVGCCHQETDLGMVGLLLRRKNYIKHTRLVEIANAKDLRLITVCKVATRRSRKVEDKADFHSASYKYTIRVKRDGSAVDIPICYKAMLALHGITAHHIQNIQKSMKSTGTAPKDGRGRHTNRPQMLPNDTTHINSFKGRHSHHSFNDSKQLYLSENFNLKKMHQLYTEKYTNNKVSYETHRDLFNTKHNISFGYPRKYTCSTCDSYKIKWEKLLVGNEDVLAVDPCKAHEITRDLKKMETEHELHLRKAQAFYSSKRKSLLDCRKTMQREAICIDFQKNLDVPNIATNVTMTFPEHGHSYMECDSNMALIIQKAIAEIPSGWNEEILTARVKTQPFKVVSCESQCAFLAWTKFLTLLYATQCPFATRPIKNLAISQDHPRPIQYPLT